MYKCVSVRMHVCACACVWVLGKWVEKDIILTKSKFKSWIFVIDCWYNSIWKGKDPSIFYTVMP